MDTIRSVNLLCIAAVALSRKMWFYRFYLAMLPICPAVNSFQAGPVHSVHCHRATVILLPANITPSICCSAGTVASVSARAVCKSLSLNPKRLQHLEAATVHHHSWGSSWPLYSRTCCAPGVFATIIACGEFPATIMSSEPVTLCKRFPCWSLLSVQQQISSMAVSRVLYVCSPCIQI